MMNSQLETELERAGVSVTDLQHQRIHDSTKHAKAIAELHDKLRAEKEAIEIEKDGEIEALKARLKEEQRAGLSAKDKAVEKAIEAAKIEAETQLQEKLTELKLEARAEAARASKGFNEKYSNLHAEITKLQVLLHTSSCYHIQCINVLPISRFWSLYFIL